MNASPHPDGTPQALRPVAERVLAWVALQRRRNEPVPPIHGWPVRRVGLIPADDLRAIELCALATHEAALFHDLYGPRGGDDAPAAQVQDEC